MHEVSGSSAGTLAAPDPVERGTNGVLDVFLGQGVLGAMCCVLLFAIWRLQQKLNEVQEARVAQALKTTEAVAIMTAALERNTAAIERAQRLQDSSITAREAPP